MTKSRILCLCALLAVTKLPFAQVPKKKPAASTPAPASPAVELAGLDDLARQVMKEWKVPGVALAVVQNGKVIYAKGYGYRDLANKLPVTTATLFPIGSITKSFTALTFGILKTEGNVDWDKPVRTYLPEFQMYDPVASEQATPCDFLASHGSSAPRPRFVFLRLQPRRPGQPLALSQA